MHVVVISQPEVVGILYRALGPDRAWSDFLADCARHRDGTDYHGLRLLPVCRLKLPGDRCKRPFYDTRDVGDFVREAIAKHPGSKPDRRLIRQKHLVEMDPGALALPHGMRLVHLVH